MNEVSTATFHMQACHVGARIDVRELEKEESALVTPLMLRAGNRGHVAVFRFGVLVFINLTESERQQAMERLRPRIVSASALPPCEEVEVRLGDADKVETNGVIVLRDASTERLQVVSEALAKSAVLAHYEQALAQVFDRMEKLAERLRQGASRMKNQELLREIGDTLLIQSRMVGRVEVVEKPELTWDLPELDRFYERLAAEYELRERDTALNRKLELVATIANTHLQLLYNRRTLRVEWYIVILIVFEIVLALIDKAFA